MNEKELGRRLLEGSDAATPAGVTALTQRVLQRDRRRVTLLAAACVVAWMAVVMLPWSLILPMLAKVVEHEKAAAAAPASAPVTGGIPASTHEMLEIVKTATTLTFLCSIASMFVAACFTVALVVASRRATLRQVNARLAEISTHVQALAKNVR